jgi:hypothetical protein
VSAGTLAYDDTDSFGHASIAFLGVAVVAGGIYLWRKWKLAEAPGAEAQ